jgi:hypothetical protein
MQSSRASCRRWLRPRSPAVESLSFAVVLPDPVDPNYYAGLPLPLHLLSAFSHSPTAPCRLAKLAIEWPEGATLSGEAVAEQAGAARGLRKLAFPAVGQLVVYGSLAAALPQLTDFSLADGTLVVEKEVALERGTGEDEHSGDEQSDGSEDEEAPAVPDVAWLPPSVTQLYLENVGLRALPRVLAHLPALRRWAAGIAVHVDVKCMDQ